MEPEKCVRYKKVYFKTKKWRKDSLTLMSFLNDTARGKWA